MMATTPGTPHHLPPREPVWDLFVRVFHWSLVACVVFNYFIQDDGETLHQWAGYTACALVLARVVWGFVGTPHARFASFWPTPTRVMMHLRELQANQHHGSPGHNPLGALAMLALMTLVLSLGVTGWMQGLDAFWGDETLQTVHEMLGHALILLAGLHATAALIMGRLERTRLIKAMVTGVKERY